jgi:hypothetical protein
MSNKQTGPVTPSGREASSKNAFKHGATSPKLANAAERQRYEELINGLQKEYKS